MKQETQRKRLSLLLLFFIVLISMFYFMNSDNEEYTKLPKEWFKSLNEVELKAHMRFLSDDLLEGRGVGTRGEELTVKYVETQMQSYGLETFVQNVPLVGLTPSNPSPLQLSSVLASESQSVVDLAPIENYIVSTDVASESVVLNEHSILFVGYGIYAPEYRWNDYKGIDVTDKWLLCLVNEPNDPVNQPELFKGNELTYYGRWMYKLEEARRRKARGVILIHTPESAGYPFAALTASQEQVQLQQPPSNPLKGKIWIDQTGASKLANLCHTSLESWQAMASSRDFSPISYDIRIQLKVDFKLRHFHGQNVLGLLEGTTQKDEYVILSSHHDHLGTGIPDKSGDNIYNGAQDNASGVSALLASVRLLASSSYNLRRSILFVSLTGEEFGLLGAFHYVNNPLFPIAKTVANINLDITNLFGPTLDIVGLGADLSDLDRYFRLAAADEGLSVSQDPNPGSGSYYRSDTFAFARAGIPAVYIWTGRNFINQPNNYYFKARQQYVDNQYHKPNDEYDESINLEGTIQQTRVMLRMVYKLANSPKWPRFYKQQVGAFQD